MEEIQNNIVNYCSDYCDVSFPFKTILGQCQLI